jgi:DNA-binding IclR family transcriptional regulator
MSDHSSISKAVDLLFFLNGQTAACGVSQIAGGLGMPKTSAHRLLRALCHRSLVEQDEFGRYQLGLGLVALGLGAARQEPLVRAARPVMRDVAARLGETLFLVGEQAGDLVVLDKVEGNGFLRISPQVGARVPPHATAAGRLYLAFARDRVHFNEAELAPFTKKTPSTPARLRRGIEAVRASGVATSNDDWIEGLSAIAAPVWLSGRLFGAIVVACVTPRMRELSTDALTRAVVEASKKITQRLEQPQ